MQGYAVPLRMHHMLLAWHVRIVKRPSCRVLCQVCSAAAAHLLSCRQTLSAVCPEFAAHLGQLG